MTAVQLRNIDPKELLAIAEVLKVISHPVRLQILELLEVHKSMCVTEILNSIEIDQPQLSHHLAKMREKGVLITERQGKNIYYSLGFEQITKIFDCMQNCYLK